ncbi:MAG: hypothetical protein HPY66_2799 [Firmicutes bacterium]|nr:hypothetical protein [Bacillota bacterium]MDI6705924.1 DUF5317 domain-containing protein [Bacillota bacterium]
MFIVFFVVLSILIGFLRGGKLSHLIKKPLKFQIFVVLSFLIQIAIFSKLADMSHLSRFSIIFLHVISYVLLLLFTLLNWKIAGIPIIGTGILLNAIAIFSNGGYMPALADNLLKTAAGKGSEAVAYGGAVNNSIQITDSTRFPWLCDIFVLPSWLPFSNVFSVGDIIIAVGVSIYLVINMGRKNQPRA